MKFALTFFLSLLMVAGCSSVPKNPEGWMAKYENSCVPTAIAFKQGLERQGIWARAFSYRYTYEGKDRGHAMTAFLYPSGANKLWTYDALGSWRVRAYTNDVRAIADYAHAVRGAESFTRQAEWLD